MVKLVTLPIEAVEKRLIRKQTAPGIKNVTYGSGIQTVIRNDGRRLLKKIERLLYPPERKSKRFDQVGSKNHRLRLPVLSPLDFRPPDSDDYANK